MNVNYYIPSEFQALVNPETSTIYPFLCRFNLEEKDDKLFLTVNTDTAFASEEVSEDICLKICELYRNNKLTNAVVNQILSGLKKSVIQKILQDNMSACFNMSQLLQISRGYILKDGNPVAVFIENALNLDFFNDVNHLSFTASFGSTDKIITLAAENQILVENEHATFMLLSSGKIYRVVTIVENKEFKIQQFVKDNDMMHRGAFENGMLMSIYQCFTMKQNRFALLRH